MKKFLLSIFAVMLAVFSVQAQDVVLDFTTNDWGFPSNKVQDGVTHAYTNTAGYTISLVTPTGSTNGFNFNSSGYLLFGRTGSILTLPTFDFAVSKIEIVGRSGASSSVKEGLYAGDTKLTQFVGAAGTNTFEIPEANQAAGTVYSIKVESNHNTQITKINIYKAATAGGEEVVETVATPVFTPESTTFNEGESVFVSIATETQDAEIYYTLDGTDPSAENGELYEGEIEITETTTVKAIAVKEGWNNSEVVEATFTAIDPNGGTFELVASELGIANGVAVESLTFGNVTATFGKGSNSNAPKYYTSGTAIRCYGGNTITFTGAKGVTITGIELTYGSSDGSNAITADCGTFSANTWTGASNEVVLTIGGTSGNRRIAAIEVSYSVGENVVVIATPSITASTSFVGSTTVEITNNEEGTTLYYSTNGVDYDAYTEALNITETTTVYAKAVDAQGNESAVAEATYTKIEVLSIAEAKAAYDAAGANVDVAVDLTGAVVTVNNGQYLFIENETTGINIYNSGAAYAEGTKFTAGYILGTSTTYRNMHQLSNVEFCGVETTTATVEPLEVAIADIAGNYDEYEGRFVKLTGVSIDAEKNMTQGDDKYKAYDRFALGFGAIANCDVTGVVAIYNTGEQLYIKDITYTLAVSDAEYATLYLDFNAQIPTFEGEDAGAYIVKASSINDGYITLEPVTDVLPANTGVIVKAAKANYTFVYSTDEVADVTGNLLSGTTKDTVIESAAYVLGIKDGIVGLYAATTNGYAEGTFLNNANKAYLPKTAGMSAASYSFRFGEGTTGIENVEVENAVKAIYDLTGRKVEAITAPGIYIVNGVKRVVR